MKPGIARGAAVCALVQSNTPDAKQSAFERGIQVAAPRRPLEGLQLWALQNDAADLPVEYVHPDDLEIFESTLEEFAKGKQDRREPSKPDKRRLSGTNGVGPFWKAWFCLVWAPTGQPPTQAGACGTYPIG